MTELPEEMLDPTAPPGVPIADQSRAAPLWCTHRVRWTHVHQGYVADDAAASPHPGHDLPARDAGAIPCQPTSALDPDRYPHAAPWALDDLP